jgi:hypothetical protein
VAVGERCGAREMDRCEVKAALLGRRCAHGSVMICDEGSMVLQATVNKHAWLENLQRRMR